MLTREEDITQALNITCSRMGTYRSSGNECVLKEYMDGKIEPLPTMNAKRWTGYMYTI